METRGSNDCMEKNDLDEPGRTGKETIPSYEKKLKKETHHYNVYNKKESETHRGHNGFITDIFEGKVVVRRPSELFYFGDIQPLTDFTRYGHLKNTTCDRDMWLKRQGLKRYLYFKLRNTSKITYVTVYILINKKKLKLKKN